MDNSFSELSLEECRNFLDELPNVDKESFSAYFNEEEMESQMTSLSNCNGTTLLKTLTLALSTIMHSPEEAGTFLSFDLLSFFHTSLADTSSAIRLSLRVLACEGASSVGCCRSNILMFLGAKISKFITSLLSSVAAASASKTKGKSLLLSSLLDDILCYSPTFFHYLDSIEEFSLFGNILIDFLGFCHVDKRTGFFLLFLLLSPDFYSFLIP
jgi:hypothetical protein